MPKGKNRTAEENERLRDHAKLLYVVQGLTNQKELAKRVGVTIATINKWINADEEHWKRMRESVLITKESELRRNYMQLSELNDKIMAKPAGERFANSKEADIMVKITKSIRQMETEASIADTMEVLKNLINHVQEDDYDLAKTITMYADSLIKSMIR